MGVNTDYLGHVNIVPSLNQAEYDYLRAFTASRRCERRAGPYAVTEANPYRARKRRADAENELAVGQPSFWCHWEPCPYGCCLSWNGCEKFYAGADWLRYLINHFLRPGAFAQRSGDQQFDGFTFDHEVDGCIVGEKKDVRELFALFVSDGQVEQVVLGRGDPAYGEEGHLRDDERTWLARDDRTRSGYGDPWDQAYDPWETYDPYGSRFAGTHPLAGATTQRLTSERAPRPAAEKSAPPKSAPE